MSNSAFFVKFLNSYAMGWSCNQGFNGFNQGSNGFNQGFNGFNQGFNGINQGFNDHNRGNNNFNQNFNGFNQGYNNCNQNFNGYNQRYNNCNQNFNGLNQGYNNCNQNFNGFNQGYNNFNQNFNGYNCNQVMAYNRNCNQAVDYNRNCNNYESCNNWNMRYSDCWNQYRNAPNSNYNDGCLGEPPQQIESNQRNERKRTRSRTRQTQQLTKVAKKSLKIKLKAQREALKEALTKKIEPTNKGYEMLQKMGYTEGQGLGKTKNGIIEPIKIELKIDRKGLGSIEEEEKPLTKKQRKRLAKAQRKEQASVKAEKRKSLRKESAALAVPIKTKLSEKEKDVMLKRMMQTDTEVQETSTVIAATLQKRAHSPIRAPSLSPPLTSFHVNKNAASTPLKNASSIVSKEKVVNRSTAKDLIEKAVTTLETTVNKTINKRLLFSLKEHSNARQLELIAEQFRDEIEVLQLQLDAKLAHTNEDSNSVELVVAEITMGDSKTIENQTFEFIRTELVGWIGKYQIEQFNTPIFHNMTNNGTHITIVCEDTYAFGCVQQCIDEIAKMYSLPVQVTRMPSISNTLYCFGAIYAGVIRDPELFLAQIKLHKFHLAAEHWIIVSHKVYEQKQRETHFMFLLDEQSALALTYHYHNKLFICLQLVEFANRGRLVPTF